MKIAITLSVGACLFCLFADATVAAPEPLAVQIQAKGPNVEIVWPAKSGVRVGGVRFSAFELQQSFDLKSWQAIKTVPANQDGADCRVEKDRKSVV